MDLVFEFSNMLPKDICTKIIEKFKSDPKVKRYQNEDFLHISQLLEWDEIMNDLKIKLKEFVEMFEKHWRSKWPEDYFFSYEIVNNESLFVRKINKCGVWECPYYIEQDLERMFAFFVYLSDEGETDFIHKKVKAKVGKVVMFPATWHDLYSHINCEGRFMLTGFFYRPLPICQ